MNLNLYNYISSIPDYPKKGITFRDISPLMKNGDAYHQATSQIANFARNNRAEIVVGPEARGFIVGCPVAIELGVGFIPARKQGKLPGKTIHAEYNLEYGTSSLYMHENSICSGQKVLITDDLLATGGTIAATINLVERLGGIVVGCAFIIELKNLHGADKLKGYNIFSLLEY